MRHVTLIFGKSPMSPETMCLHMLGTTWMYSFLLGIGPMFFRIPMHGKPAVIDSHYWAAFSWGLDLAPLLLGWTAESKVEGLVGNSLDQCQLTWYLSRLLMEAPCPFLIFGSTDLGKDQEELITEQIVIRVCIPVKQKWLGSLFHGRERNVSLYLAHICLPDSYERLLSRQLQSKTTIGFIPYT